MQAALCARRTPSRLAVLLQPQGPSSQTRRWKATARNRFNDIRRRATEQHPEYLKQLGGPPKSSLLADVEPKLNSRLAETRQILNGLGYAREEPSTDLPPSDMLLRAEQALQPKYAGMLAQYDFEPFGTIQVLHEDIFNADVEAIILPMTPNLMPYRGLSLEVFDRGGPELVKETFKRAQDKEERPNVGDTIVVDGRGVRADKIMFVILPWYWQGNRMDATKRLRHSVRSALDDAGSPEGFSSVALPSLGAGVYGYEPSRTSLLLLEEAVDVLLQIDKLTPHYGLKHISLIENRRDTAECFGNALTEIAHRWLPDRRMTTAAEWWGTQSRRLIMLPARPGIFWRKHKVKFKKHHGVVRKARRNYIGNIKPKLWRAHRVAQPPPLRVFRESGEVAPSEQQFRARPHYFRGVSHWLFPARRTGFQGLRKGAKGQWVAVNRQYRLREDFRPRL